MHKLSDKLRQIASEERRLTAFHEAGHAALLWFFQLAAVKHIRLPLESEFLIANSYEDSNCKPAGQLSTHLGLLKLHMSLGEFGLIETLQYYRFDIMLSMGGPIAEAICECDSVDADAALDYDWFHDMRDAFESGGESASQDDYADILSSAERAYPEDPRLSEKAIYLAARWTNEIFSNPRMQTLVRNLAAAMLRRQESYFSGEFVWHQMSLAWNNQTLPIFQRRWRRRFARFLNLSELTKFCSLDLRDHEPT